ncbi:HTTM domain-containing protein [Spectribacter hydrogenoxidans]|uniref:HTTM domain-containing protein n=1 Tax=Spectribacter hydrogenoxidans TaxID=3075608 RepID=A0ABU3BW17_9GAMM|nr:HTTM domain-containing protein [Salinisphaera sp. W335]MDT0633489.1 HTTM domain-containing protein [Salinisphaera sp. W335]
MNALYHRLNQPLDIAALAVFRMLFGALMFAGTLRFMACGWIEQLYVAPDFHFKYWGFAWVQVPGEAGLYLLYTGIAATAAMVALGAFYRVAIIGFWCLFTYAELMDVTYYLNHYYFVSLLALILCFLSPHRAWSVDAWHKPGLARATLPAWQTWWLRFQVGLLYFYAGLAKAEPDWLLHAQPLNIWLPPLSGMPLLGPFLAEPWVHYAFSWFAFAFDTTIIAFLLWRVTRPYAFAVVLVFHLFTHLFFQIGLFPFIMVFAVLVFFEPDWPRRWMPFFQSWLPASITRLFGALSPSPSPARGSGGQGSGWRPTSAAFALVVAAFCLVQFIMPLRHWAYPGTVLWHEQGMRFSWRVMLREKSGSLNYRVVTDEGRTVVVTPHDYLTELQYREMAGQPDLVLQLAHHIRDDFNRRGHGPVEVYADSLVSLNGRPSKPMIDPQANLAAVEPGLADAEWITDAPSGPPTLHRRLQLTAGR